MKHRVGRWQAGIIWLSLWL